MDYDLDRVIRQSTVFGIDLIKYLMYYILRGLKVLIAKNYHQPSILPKHAIMNLLLLFFYSPF